MTRVWFVPLLVAASCSRAHIRTYDVTPNALVVIQDENSVTHPIEPGEEFVATNPKQAVLVIEDVRQTRYPLDKGWKVTRDRECLTIETIPTFKPY
ncbi:MAG: hypothetical protein HYY17_04060 [Planctomycetes bacterium]|nr:hypothetical protein [Planctomycetota bacterium]